MKRLIKNLIFIIGLFAVLLTGCETDLDSFKKGRDDFERYELSNTLHPIEAKWNKSDTFNITIRYFKVEDRRVRNMYINYAPNNYATNDHYICKEFKDVYIKRFPLKVSNRDTLVLRKYITTVIEGGDTTKHYKILKLYKTQ